MTALLLPGLALGGCAGSADRYPSLSVRDFERLPQASVDDQQLEPSPAGEELQARIGYLVDAANTAHRAFTDASPEADRIVSAAAGTSVEDNIWSSAQVALADLDSKRGATAVALGDLDMLYSDATLDFVTRDGIAQARDKVAMLIAMEDQTLDRLRSRLDR